MPTVRRLLARTASTLAFATLPALAHAQSPPAPPASDRLPTVEIIGVSPIGDASVPLDRIPANVQTARSQDIERSRAFDLTEFMNRRLGSVYLNETQNNRFQPDLNFRGYTASPLLGSQQGLSICLDGVRLNQPFGDVVSWDLIPRAAIATIALDPGSNPLFGLNTLGGALVAQTKDGERNPGTSVQVRAGSHQLAAVEFEHGGSNREGMHWYVTGNRLHERGWRDDSPSSVGQLFGKVGQRDASTDVSLSASLADTDLTGNGLQEESLLARDRASVYTQPDNTKNRSVLLNLALSRALSRNARIAGNAYFRQIRTRTLNGDLNDDALDQPLYQPTAAEQQALANAGYTGVPTAGENAANTPFPKWRCIANALLGDAPAQTCNGVIHRTATDQHNAGVQAQLDVSTPLFGLASRSLVGAAADVSRSHFTQASELGYLNPDRSVSGVGAFGDAVTGGTIDGEPYDTRVDLDGRAHTTSVFASTIVDVAPGASLTVSGRYNRTSIRNRDAIRPSGVSGSLDGDQTFHRFNPAIGLTFRPIAGTTAWLGISQGSRNPSSIELGCADPAHPCKLPNAFAGDPPLKQVVTTTIEAGLRGGTAGSFAWSAGVFRSDNKDDLLFVADDPAGSGYFKNFGKTRRQGIELAASAEPMRHVSVGANLTLLDATFRSAETIDGSSNSSNDAAQAGDPGVAGTIAIAPGNRIPLVPRRLLKLYGTVALGDAWSIGADVLAVGRSSARGNENGQHAPDGVYYLGSGENGGYAVLNLNAATQPATGVELFAQIYNVLDRAYSTAAQLGAAGFNAAGAFQAQPFPANANGDRPLQNTTFYAPGAPRTLVVGLRYLF